MAVPASASACAADGYRPPELTGLADLLDRPTRERPRARALVVGASRRPVSFRDLSALAGDLAARLAATGLRRGDPVGLVAADTAEFVVALFGAARAGLVAAPLDPALPAPELAARLDALGVPAVLLGPSADGGPPLAPLPVPAWPLRVEVSPTGTASLTADLAAAPRRAGRAAHELTSGDALVLHTSGTAARARMVPLTQANVAASVRGICATYRLGPGDATVAVMPFFHGHGLFASLLASLAGGGGVLLPAGGRFSARTFWDDMRAASATWFSAVPSLHEVLLERAEFGHPGPQGPPLRFVRSSSAPLNPATQRALERAFGAPLLSAYGMTESTHQATSEPLPQDGVLKHGSAGRPTGVEVRVVDREGRPCPAGVRGEVWLSGPTVARGYLADPVETARGFSGGWLRTGDLGSLDEDGHLRLTGRITTVISRGTEKISPEHVEDVLAGCPGVAEAAVFALPDAVYGQRVGAALVVRDPECAGAEEVLRHCRERLAPFEVPERLVFVAALPYTAKGGLDRLAVEARFAR
ncbi:FadD7 family fatty acid--CoA ligase [Streptomyces sp. NPDC048674]|uniref:FadD7 family fatty acid--CoA ligase n=1 Tax=Streptomyces sp. NPDC048674 TaxID=3155491 RepID=UPI003426964A